MLAITMYIETCSRNEEHPTFCARTCIHMYTCVFDVLFMLELVTAEQSHVQLSCGMVCLQERSTTHWEVPRPLPQMPQREPALASGEDLLAQVQYG